VREYRPLLYRAADALDRTGGARELADSLYAELYGVRDGGRERKSLFGYFSGQSSLGTWLRAVLAQRYVDRLRGQRRIEPLPDEEGSALRRLDGLRAVGEPPDPDRPRHMRLMRSALGRVVSRLASRDRLRLACYYVQALTLAETGRVLNEHEATVSRQLTRTRRTIRDAVERELREVDGLTSEQIQECFVDAADNPGPLDLGDVLDQHGADPTVAERLAR
jgi:RNA polymerase sigma factor (sigma-70 family)